MYIFKVLALHTSWRRYIGQNQGIYIHIYVQVCVHTHYELGTAYIHTCTRKYWQENNIHRYGIQKSTNDQSDDDFHVKNNFYLPKSLLGLHVNAKTKVHEQSQGGTKVLFEAKHMCKCQQSVALICIFAKTMNFPVG